MTNALHISKNFKRMRTERNMTLEQVAHESKLSMHTINNLAQDKNTPSVETLCKIANLFGVDVNEFFKD